MNNRYLSLNKQNSKENCILNNTSLIELHCHNVETNQCYKNYYYNKCTKLEPLFEFNCPFDYMNNHLKHWKFSFINVTNIVNTIEIEYLTKINNINAKLSHEFRNILSNYHLLNNIASTVVNSNIKESKIYYIGY